MRIVLSLDSWPALRDFAANDRSELGAAASLAELAGVDSLRLSINEDLMPVREADVDALRRAARSLELRMPISEQLLWWVFFLDGIVAAPEIADLKGMTLDDFRFSVGGGLRFTIPQFPIRLYLAKRFRILDGKIVPEVGDLPFFGTTVEFVISLGGDTFF